MAAVRKSEVSATGTWFRRSSRPSLRKRQIRQSSTLDNNIPPTTDPLLAPSKRQRHPRVNVSSPANTGQKAAATQIASNFPVQSSQKQKNLQSNSFGVTVVPTAKAAPLWLLRLYTLNRYSSIMAFLLVVGTLAVYGLTVYTQELWSQGYHRLQKLQRDERQITTTNATLTNKMAEEAEQPAAGLVSPTPARTIFLSPTRQNPMVVTPSAKPNSPIQPSNSSRLGY